MFCTERSWENPDPYCVVKLVKDGALAEPGVYDYLLNNLSNPRNHTLPCEVVHADPSIIIMPFVDNLVDTVWSYGPVYDGLYQILEVGHLLTLCVRMITHHMSILGNGVPTPPPCCSYGTGAFVRFQGLSANYPSGNRTFTRRTC